MPHSGLSDWRGKMDGTSFISSSPLLGFVFILSGMKQWSLCELLLSHVSVHNSFFFPSQTARAQLSSNLYKKSTVWGVGFHSFSNHEGSSVEFSYFKMSPSEEEEKSLQLVSSKVALCCRSGWHFQKGQCVTTLFRNWMLSYVLISHPAFFFFFCLVYKKVSSCK